MQGSTVLYTVPVDKQRDGGTSLDVLRLQERISGIVRDTLKESQVGNETISFYTKLIAESLQRSFRRKRSNGSFINDLNESELEIIESEVVEAANILRSLHINFFEFFEHYGIKQKCDMFSLWRGPNKTEISLAVLGRDDGEPRFLELWECEFANYFKKDWLQHDRIDIAIMYALLSVELVESLAKERYRGFVSGRSLRDIIIYECMGRKFRNYRVLSAVVFLLLTFIFWGALPSLLIYSIGDVINLNTLSGVFLIFSFLIYFILLGMYNIFKMADNYHFDKHYELQVKFINLAFQSMSNGFIYPSFLQQVIEAASRRGIFFSPTISVILERLAEERKIILRRF